VGIQQGGNASEICLKRIGKAHLHCPGIDSNADYWVIEPVSAVYDASTTAYI